MSRSYLFIPGNTPSMIQNLDVFESDSIIIDFEDSVISYDKDAARILINNFLKKFKFNEFDIYIRINDSLSPNFLKDVETTVDLDIKGYVLPKASVEAVNKLNDLIKNKNIIPIIESPLSLLKAEEIAACNNVTGLLFGAEDYTKELGISRTLNGTEILYARSIISIVCNAYGIESIDTPYTSKDDETGLREDSIHAKNLGFTAKSLIHPNQVEIVNEVFSPTSREIFEAKRIIKKSEESDKGAFSLDGKMIDLPIIEKAKKVLNKAKKYNL